MLRSVTYDLDLGEGPMWFLTSRLRWTITVGRRDQTARAECRNSLGWIFAAQALRASFVQIPI